MLLYFLGTRGTVPSAGQGTMSLCVDNKFVFDICPEFVQSMTKLVDRWNNTENPKLQRLQSLYGRPSFSAIEHVFISHFHLDHWGGLRHLLTRASMFEKDTRISKQKPIHIYIPKFSDRIISQRLQFFFDAPHISEIDPEDFFKRYLLVEVGGEIDNMIQVHVVDPDDGPIQIGDYTITARFNKHMFGSLGYKIQHTKWKLDLNAQKKLQFPKNRLLGRLQREGQIRFKDKTIQREDLFSKIQYKLGYSGDTPFDKDFLHWFEDVDVLLHECTYLEDDESHHSDVHTVFSELIQFLPNLNLKAFFPVHISQRYTYNEIEKFIDDHKEIIPQVKILLPKAWDIYYLQNNEISAFALEVNDKW